MNVLSRARVATSVALLATFVAVIGGPPAHASSAAGPPTIQSVIPEPPQTTSITIDTSLNPNGLDTSLVIEYGRTMAYGSRTPPQDAGAGTTSTVISTRITGLTPGTNYQFLVTAINGAGSAREAISYPTNASSSPPTTTSIPVSTSSSRFIRVAAASPGTFQGDTCASAVECFAVGFASTARGAFHSIIERWTGHSFVATVSPALGETTLWGVSCSTPRFCVAVGEAGEPKAVTVVESWNGQRWARVASPSPNDVANGDSLRSVSCPSSTSCWAVGMTAAGETYGVTPLTEHWNGRTWSVVPTPNPGGAFLEHVACPLVNDCWAVGAGHSTPTSQPPLIEHWNGYRWSVVATSTGGRSNSLAGVTCLSASTCWAVGSDVVLHLVAGAWRAVAVPTLALRGTALDGVSCASLDACWFVGAGTGARWNGHRLSLVALPAIGGEAYLSDVACPSTTRCIAVGGYGSRGQLPLAVVTPG